jgi:hypothetical protein
VLSRNPTDSYELFGSLDSGGSVTPLARYTISILPEPRGSGSVIRNPDQADYEEGTLVALTAVSNSGYQFVRWGILGSIIQDPTQNPMQITMNSNKAGTALFEPSGVIGIDPPPNI